MSLAELKKEIVKLTDEERTEVATLLHHLLRKDDPEYRAELARRMDRMDAGEFRTEEDVARLNEQPPVR